MTAIIIPRRHYTQPQGRVQASPYWPMERLLAYDGDTEAIEDVVHGRAYGFPTQFQGGLHLAWVPSTYGVGLREINTISSAARQIHIPDVVPQSPRWSIVGRLRQAGNEAFYQSGNASGGGLVAENNNIQLRIQSGKLQFVRHGVAVVVTSVATIPTNTEFSFIVTFNGATARLYIDGVLDATASYSYTFPTTSANQCLWRSATGSTLAFFGIANRELSAYEAKALHDNPWQLFRADPIRIYSLPSGAITLNRLTMSAITQTTARATLSVTR